MGKGIRICDSCNRDIVFCKESLCCEICGKPQVSIGEKGQCYECLVRTYRAYKKAAAVVKYDSVASRGVKSYKSGNNPAAGAVFAQLMAERIETEFPGISFDFLVGVPPNIRRIMKRGMDPVGELCAGISKITGIPYRRNVLKRIKDVPKQSGLGYAKRLQNMIGAIGVGRDSDFGGATVLLIDDVMTTGATLNECGYILKKGGAKNVYALTFATAVKEPKTYNNVKNENI